MFLTYTSINFIIHMGQNQFTTVAGCLEAGKFKVEFRSENIAI